ncbi:MAG TPA: redoxin domain-containing protein [Bacteroidia bacterium]|nr:redoxin domain-containing protein [Bacteroidia bacterium]
MDKTKSILLSGLFFVSAIFSSHAANKVHDLKFNLAGVKNTIVFLGCTFGDKDYIQDTAKVDEKGNCEFSGDKDMPGGVYFIMLKSKTKFFEFIIDKDQKFSMSADTVDFIKSMKVTGSEENKLFYEYLHYITIKHDELDTLQKQAKNGPDKDGAKVKLDTLNAQVTRYKLGFIHTHSDMLLSKLFNAAEEPTIPPSPKLANGRADSTFPYRYYKAHFFDNVDFTDGRLVRSRVFYPKIKEYLERLTVQDPDSIIAAADYLVQKAGADKDMYKFIVAYITSTYESSNIMGMDAVFVHMAERYYTPEKADWVSATQLEKIKNRAQQLDPILIGKRAPTLVMPDSNNVMQAFDSIKAEYTILYFWDFDCGHCQKETPKLIRWYDSIKAEGIEVYAIQTNESSTAKWKDYVKAHKLDWINVMDIYHTSNFRHDYDVLTTPMLYLLNENKTIIAKKIDTQDLDKVLKHYKEKQWKK